jgi:hypothetical protein
MRQRVSDTAKWGDIACGPRVIDARVKENMKQLLKEIQSGQFARQWIAEHEAGRPTFTKLMRQDDEHLIEQTGKKLRAMMPWIGSDSRQKAEGRKQKAGGRRQRAEGRRQKAEGRKPSRRQARPAGFALRSKAGGAARSRA